MENPTSYAGQGQGFFGKLDCLKYSLPTCFRKSILLFYRYYTRFFRA